MGHDKNVKKRKKREERQKFRKESGKLDLDIDSSERKFGKKGLIGIAVIMVVACAFIFSNLSS
jgi:hypothetical protein